MLSRFPSKRVMAVMAAASMVMNICSGEGGAVQFWLSPTPPRLAPSLYNTSTRAKGANPV